MEVMWWMWAAATVSVLQVPGTSSQRDQAVFCSVCRGLVAEINGRISAVDPRKTVQIGSYRLDHRGNQNLVQVKYATSDVHLAEILEDVCEAFNDYGLLHDDVSERQVVVRTKDRSGKELDTSKVKASAKLRETFKNYCEEMIEENEDDIMTIFKQEDLDVMEGQLCGEISGACRPEELTEAVPALREKPAAQKAAGHSLHMLDSEGSARPMGSTDSLEEMKRRIVQAVNSAAAANDDENCDGDEDGDEKDEL